MKIFIAQQNYIIGDYEYNSQKIISAIRAAKEQHGDLIIFSELALCGYPPKDFLEFDDFIQDSLGYLEHLEKEAAGIAVLVGSISINPSFEGKDLYNSVFFIEDKKIKQVIHKSLLPNYDIFDEYRYFEPASEWHCVPFKGKKLAVTICEDIWDLTEDPLYKSPPMASLIKEQPDIMINLSASPFSITHRAERLATAQRNVKKYKLPIIYATSVGAQADIIFDGGSFVLEKSGETVQQLPYYKEALSSLIWNEKNELNPLTHKDAGNRPTPDRMPQKLNPELNINSIYESLIFGIRDFFDKMGFEKALITSSGGIDSAVSLCLACEALGAEKVQALLLPSDFSTDHSVTDAEKLSQNLRNPYETIEIKDAFDNFLKTLSPLFKKTPFGVAEENLQARIRGVLAMAYSNKFGHLLLNCSNKSELAIGYGTQYGDLTGGLSIIGDCYKTQVYALARYINRKREIIPKHILSKAPSAELRPGQKDTDSLPQYEQMDDLLYRYIECKHRKASLIKDGFSKELVHRVLKMVTKNEFKRVQFCPILRVSNKAFGIGRRMPVVAKYEN